MEIPGALLEAVRRAHRIAVLTGAGISQESGLRTFRDPQSGIWRKYKPEDLASPEGFRRNPRTVWDWYVWRRSAIEGVRPNAGHYALVDMECHVEDFTLITQNVDGLHAAAGARAAIELHGNIRRVRCADCGVAAEEWEDSPAETPRCVVCGGLLRPDVVWFGEPVPRAALERALQASTACEVFFSIGTSALVQPAAALPYLARRSGAMVIEINPEATPLTESADFSLRGKAGEILPALVKAIWE